MLQGATCHGRPWFARQVSSLELLEIGFAACASEITAVRSAPLDLMAPPPQDRAAAALRQLLRVFPAKDDQLHRELQESEYPHGCWSLWTLGSEASWKIYVSIIGRTVNH